MMELPETRYSMIARLADRENTAVWEGFVRCYEGSILRYCLARGLQEADAREVAQEVLLATHKAAENWQPSGRKGSFRAWLFETAHRNCLSVLRKQNRSPQNLADDAWVADDQSRKESDHQDWQRWAFSAAAETVQREVQPTTWLAFWKTAVEDIPPAVVADELGVSLGTVYTARSRVLMRIRKFIDELSQT